MKKYITYFFLLIIFIILINQIHLPNYPSPNGEYIIFQKLVDGYWQLYIRGKNLPLQLLYPVPEKAHRQFSVWSPDGEKIAFYQKLPYHNEYRLYLMNIDNLDKANRIVDNVSLRDNLPSWSADSNKLLYLALKQNKITYGVYRYDTNKHIVLEDLPLVENLHWSTSPLDNNTILYYEKYKKNEIKEYKLTSELLAQLEPEPKSNTIIPLSILPSSTIRLIFSHLTDEKGNPFTGAEINGQLGYRAGDSYIIDINGTPKEPLELLITAAGFNPYKLTLTPQGKFVPIEEKIVLHRKNLLLSYDLDIHISDCKNGEPIEEVTILVEPNLKYFTNKQGNAKFQFKSNQIETQIKLRKKGYKELEYIIPLHQKKLEKTYCLGSSGEIIITTPDKKLKRTIQIIAELGGVSVFLDDNFQGKTDFLGVLEITTSEIAYDKILHFTFEHPIYNYQPTNLTLEKNKKDYSITIQVLKEITEPITTETNCPNCVDNIYLYLKDKAGYSLSGLYVELQNAERVRFDRLQSDMQGLVIFQDVRLNSDYLQIEIFHQAKSIAKRNLKRGDFEEDKWSYIISDLQLSKQEQIITLDNRNPKPWTVHISTLKQEHLKIALTINTLLSDYLGDKIGDSHYTYHVRVIDNEEPEKIRRLGRYRIFLGNFETKQEALTKTQDIKQKINESEYLHSELGRYIGEEGIKQIAPMETPYAILIGEMNTESAIGKVNFLREVGAYTIPSLNTNARTYRVYIGAFSETEKKDAGELLKLVEGEGKLVKRY